MISVDDADGVAVVRLGHGKVNALDLELLLAITKTMRDLADARAIVITGEGRAFSAGVDLKRIVNGGTAYVEEFLPALSEAFLAVFDCPRPVVAAVNGHAIAGGCVIAGASDVRLMSAGTIGLTELLVGVAFPTVPLEIMRYAAGPAVTRLALTGETFRPEHAQRMGLIDEVVEPDALIDDALKRAAALGQIPADVYALTKQQLHAPTLDVIQGQRTERDAAALKTWSSPETHAAITAYLTNL